ncbi:MAG: glutathione S-transferase [Maricaulaceae bacterium]|jgi:glutathione S-transferase
MIKVHHLNNSRSQRVLWLLEELGLDYEVIRYERNPQTMRAPAELKAVHPLGKSPMIEDGGEIIPETGAIFEYLLDTYDAEGRLRPAAGTPERRQFTYWLHYAEGSAMPLLLLQLIFGRIAQRKGPPVIGGIVRSVGKTALDTLIRPQLVDHLDHWERALTSSPWFAGEAFSAVDVMMSFAVEGANARVGLGDRPHLTKWLETVRARPGYSRALERGGPYQLLGG